MLATVSMCFALLAGTECAEAAPIALHPDNPHYFSWRGKPTILITSAEHYGTVLNLDFDYARYLRTLKAEGMNHTRTWAGTYREVPGDFGITGNSLAPAAGRYACPWARSEVPGAADGGWKFDLEKWDEAYFKRLKTFLREASRRGIVVELNLWCPNYDDSMWDVSPLRSANNVNGIGDCGREDVYNAADPRMLAVQIATTQKLVRETREFDNLYYEVCNEPYFGGVTVAWQHKIVEAIVEAERDLRAKHLISMNIQNGSARADDAHPAVSIINFHYATPPDTVALNYDMPRVIGDNETGFAGTSDMVYRREAWEFILAGGGLYNNLDYSFTVGHEDGTFAYPETQPGGGGQSLRRQLRVLQGFMGSFEFLKMAPHNEVVLSATGAEGEEAPRVRMLAEPGRQYALYLSGGREATVTLALPAGKYRAEWVDTLTGAVSATEDLQATGGEVTLRSPEYAEDVAVGIRAR